MLVRSRARFSRRSKAALISVAIIATGMQMAPAAHASTTATITSTGPISSLSISDTLNCSLTHAGDATSAIYGGTACGTFVVAGPTGSETLYGPSAIPAGDGILKQTGFTPVSQSPVAGTGATGDPYRIVTVVDVGTTGLRLTETDSYVVGEETYTTDVSIANSNAAFQNVIIYRAADCYLNNSDYGYGVADGSSRIACRSFAGSPGSTSPGTRLLRWTPITANAQYFQSSFTGTWQQLATKTTLPNTCQCGTYLDNGAAISWKLTVPASGSISTSNTFGFATTPALTLNVDTSSTTASPAAVDLDTLVLSPNAPDNATSGLPIGGQNIAGLPLGGQNIAGLPLGGQNIAGLPLGGQNIAGLPIGGQNIAGLPIGGQNIAGLPLLKDGGWPVALTGTALAGLPLQTVTLRQVLALSPALDIKVSDIDWTGSAFATIGAVPLALGNTTFNDITPPAGGPTWCSRFESLGFINCGTSFGGLGGTVFGYQLAGGDLANLPLNAIPLSAINLTRAPLLDIKLSTIQASIGLGRSPLGSILLRDLPSPSAVVDCSHVPVDCTNDNLAQAGAKGALTTNGAVRNLGTTSSTGQFVPMTTLGAFALGDVVLSLLPSSATPIEDVALDNLHIDRYSGATAKQLSYHLVYGYGGAAQAAAPVITVTLPTSFPYIGRSSVLTITPAGGTSTTTTPEPDVSGSTLTWSLANQTLDPGTSVQLDFKARPGLALGSFDAGATVSANGVTDTVTHQASVTVGESFEDNAGPVTAPAIAYDQAVFSHISAAGDLDNFRLPVPTVGGNPVVGARVSVTLSHVGNDDDLVVYLPGSGAVSPPRAAAKKIKLRGSLVSAPVPGSVPVADTLVAANSGPQSASQQTLADVPLSATLPVGGVSASRGLYDEQVDVQVPDDAKATDSFVVQVNGFNRSFNAAAPYVVHASWSPPPALPTSKPRVFTQPNAIPSNAPLAPSPIAASTQTLFLVSPSRMTRLYGTQPTFDMLNSLQAPSFLTRSDVVGQVVSIDQDPAISTAAAAYDNDPGNPGTANAFVRSVNALVDSLLVTGNDYALRSVVVVGSDDVIPHNRVLDFTQKVNERQYLSDLLFTTNNDGDLSTNARTSGILGALARGYVVSDAAYGDLAPYVYPGGYVDVPQLAVGRLVETPADVKGEIDRFVVNNGTLDPATAQSSLAAGYDTTADGAASVDQAFAGNGISSGNRKLLNSETWNAADLAAGFSVAPNKARSLINLQGHFNHYETLPASSSAGLFTSTPVAGQTYNLTGSVPDLNNRGIFSLSCHSALNIPDLVLGSPSVGQQTKLADWPQQFMAKNAAFLLGASGFGYSDRYTLGYGEKVMADFAKNLSPGATVSSAYVDALQGYFGGSGVIGVYDNKVLSESILFGLPTWHMPGTYVAPQAPPAVAAPVSYGSTGLLATSLTVDPTLSAVASSDGTSYFQVTSASVSDGVSTPQATGVQLPQVTQDMPITARTQVDVTQPGLAATGALITGLTSTDASNFTPSISRPVLDQSSREPSLNTADVTFPAIPAATGTAYTSQGKRQTLVVLPTQFQGTGLINGRTNGTERKFSQVKAKVFYPPAGTVPTNGATFSLVDGKVLNGTLTVNADVVDSGSPVAEVWAMYLDGGGWHPLRLASTSTVGHYAATSAQLSGSTVEFFLQAVTRDGVVRATTNKSANFSNAPAPRISISSPVNGATYTVGHVVNAAYSCTDATTGRATPTCQGTAANGAPIDTSRPGLRTFTVTAADANGTPRTETRTYSVGYTFTGFLAPVQNAPYRNAANGGQAIPFKWQLQDDSGGYFGGLAPTEVALVFQPVACATGQPIVALSTPALVLSGLTYDPVSHQYQLVVKTPKSFAGSCQQAQMTFYGDSASMQTATFEFK